LAAPGELEAAAFQRYEVQGWKQRALGSGLAITGGLALAFVVLFLGAASVFAQELPEQKPPIQVLTIAPISLLIDGIPNATFPAAVTSGSTVCVGLSQHYTGLKERWIFQKWSHGPTSECVTLTQPGAYRALYVHEVVLEIRSRVGRIPASRWVLHGTPMEVEVPDAVQDGNRIRYRFREWSGGENPFTRSNVIAPLEAMTLEVLGNGGEKLAFVSWKSVGRPVLSMPGLQNPIISFEADAPYTLTADYEQIEQFSVALQGPPGVELEGSGMYQDGRELVIRAPEVVDLASEGERLKFSSWQRLDKSAGPLLDPLSSSSTIAVDAPYTLRADYVKQYFVVATAPFGTLQRGWMDEEAELVLDVPPIEEIVPEQRRLVFKSWEGQEGLFSPRINGVVNKPLNLRAVYQPQVMVTVEAPHGSAGGGWLTMGSTTTIIVPDEAPSRFLFKESFVRFGGYGSGQSSVDVLAQDPVTIAAIYQTRVDLRVLGLLIVAIPVELALIYIVGRWLLFVMRLRTRSA